MGGRANSGRPAGRIDFCLQSKAIAGLFVVHSVSFRCSALHCFRVESSRVAAHWCIVHVLSCRTTKQMGRPAGGSLARKSAAAAASGISADDIRAARRAREAALSGRYWIRRCRRTGHRQRTQTMRDCLTSRPRAYHMHIYSTVFVAYSTERSVVGSLIVACGLRKRWDGMGWDGPVGSARMGRLVRARGQCHRPALRPTGLK